MKLGKYEKAAVDWLFRAQDATPDGGVSMFYSLGKGWSLESYKEVSGYILPTLFDLYRETKNKQYKNRAIRIADWLINVQGKKGNWDYVFDTGQVILGLTRTYKETKDQKYKNSIVGAADWLVNIQSKDGSWRRKIFAPGVKKKISRLFCSLSHSYNTRTAWALLEAWKITKNKKYKRAAVKNLNWVLSNQTKEGYYLSSTNITHFLIYTARGFLEAGLILKESKYIESARKFANGLLGLVKESGFLSGSISKNWKSVSNSSYLSANAQFSILLCKLYKITKEKKYIIASVNLINYLKKKQNLKSKNSGVLGGIPGSAPINGKYEPNKILPWATKFYIDSLLMHGKNLKIFGLSEKDFLDPQLRWITNLLNKKKIKYVVDGGTLLGLMREGKLLPQDEDIDISTWVEDKNKLTSLLPEFQKEGYKIKKGYYKKLLCSYTLFPPTFIKGREIDIKIFRKYKDYSWCPERYAKNSTDTGLIYYISKFSRAPFLMLIKIFPFKPLISLIDHLFFNVDTWKFPLKYNEKPKFLSEKGIFIPSKWQSYLKFRFHNWKIPARNWKYTRDDGGLENKDPLSLGIPLN